MRTCRAALSAVVLAASLVLGAGSASAGGPTSALLVEPASGRSASLTYVDKDYADLMALVGADDGSAGAIDTSGATHDNVPEVTVTWLVHNVSVWRVDRIYLTAKGGPWIATHVAAMESDDIFAAPPVWHTATDGTKLVTLLERLGVTGGDEHAVNRSLADRSPQIAPETPATAVQARALGAAAPTGRTAPADGSPAGFPVSSLVLFGFLGLALGTALGATAGPRSAGTRALGVFRRRRDAVHSPDDDYRIQEDRGEEVHWSSRDELTSVPAPK